MSDQVKHVGPPRPPRRFLRIAGAVLWGCVGLALLGMWLTKRPDDAAAQTAAKSEPGKVIELQPNEEGLIDLHQLFSDQPQATWDPNGIEDFSFPNCDGRTITKQDLLGRPWVVAFVFTRCTGPCPILTLRMRDLQDRFKDEDMRLVTLTVDPDRDTQDALKTYAEINGADLDRWYFLTGDAREIYGLIQRSFQMPVKMPDETTGNYQVEHSRNLMLVDAKGVVQAKYDGTSEEQMATLVRDLRRQLHPKTAKPSEAINAEIPADAWYMKLPAVNAGLNGLAGALLALGLALIKRGRVAAHKNTMLAAFAVSIVFLACYLVYHAALHHDTGLPGKKFEGTGSVRIVYFTILISHVVLAAAVPVLASITIYRGLKADWARHRRIAKITFPIWMYVSVTGVIIYAMLYHWPTGV